MTIKQVTPSDDLDFICAQITPEKWGKDNQMTNYDPEKLRAYLEDDKHVLMVAWDGDKIAGMALCYILPHPAGEDSLYVHELDTHPDYRRQGVSRAIMEKLFELSGEKGLDEVWVGTETTNKVADSFYRSLKPYEVEPSYIYSYKTK